MKNLELTKEKAQHLNEICQFAVDKGVLNSFDIYYYQTKNSQFDLYYYRHLIDVAKQYEGINRLLNVESNGIYATHNTKEFLKSGGFLRLLKIEQRENSIQNFTLTTLRQTALGTKEWFKLIGVTVLAAFSTSLITNIFLNPSSSKDSIRTSVVQSKSNSSEMSKQPSKSLKDTLKK